jgi:hypothetical protein
MIMGLTLIIFGMLLISFGVVVIFREVSKIEKRCYVNTCIEERL